MKKKMIIGISLTAVIVFSAAGFLYLKKQTGKIVSPGEPKIFTGAVLEMPSDEEKDIVKQGSDLRLLLPIQTDTYKLDFNYKTFKFEVDLKKPYDINKQHLDDWLAEKGFQNIPEDQFKFILE